MLPAVGRVGKGSYEPVRRKVFRVGGSLAVRLPKDLVDGLGIQDGSPVVFRRDKRSIIMELAEG